MATNIIALAPSNPGNFTVPHNLGAKPTGVTITMTSSGAIWLQDPVGFDATNLYLTASGAPITGTAICFTAFPVPGASGANIIDLTTVAAVNAILNQGAAVDSGIIQTEITAYSQNILTRTGRSFLSGIRSYSERYNGNGSQELPVRNYPLLAIASVMVNGIAIPASPDFIQSGYCIDTEGSICNIAIIGNQSGLGVGFADERWGVRPGGWGSYGNAPPLGQAPYRFVEGIQNVAVQYTAGYTVEVPSEAATVPATPAYTLAVANAATFWQDQGVTLASDGSPLQSVTGAPGPGQYTPPIYNAVPRGTYTFNAAQSGLGVNIAYSYGAAPFDLQEAAGRLVAEMYRKRQWIGQTSQVQPGVGTTAYSKMEVEIGTAMTIERYRMRFLA